MTAPEIWDFLSKLLGIIGGVGWLSFIVKYFADRLTEEHKWKIKKKEILFAKEIEAASAFFDLHRTFQPVWRHPDMDWDEASEEVIRSFSDYEQKLAKFIAKYGAILSLKNRTTLDRCKELAATHKFALVEGGREEQKAAEAGVDKFLELLREVEARFVQELRA